MSRKVVEIPVEVWEFSLQDAEHIAALHRETLRLMNENARLNAEVERLRKAGDAMYESKIGYYGEQILEDMKHHSGELCRNWNAAKEGKQP